MYDLTSIMWVKNEVVYIPEWIEFHLLQGVDHFILYDDNSTDDIHKVLEPYTSTGILEILEWPEHIDRTHRGSNDNPLLKLMNHCIDEQKGRSNWVFFHGIDEFLFLKDGGNIPEFLKKYEHVGALCVEWQNFNYNGHIDMPDGLVIENYTTAYEEKYHHVKTLFRPELTQSHNGNPHAVILNNGMLPLNERYYPVQSAWNLEDPGYEKICLYHYTIKSRNEFINKYNKGWFDQYPENQNNIMIHNWYEANEDPAVLRWECKDLIKYVELVKKKILERYPHGIFK